MSPITKWRGSRIHVHFLKKRNFNSTATHRVFPHSYLVLGVGAATFTTGGLLYFHDKHRDSKHQVLSDGVGQYGDASHDVKVLGRGRRQPVEAPEHVDLSQAEAEGTSYLPDWSSIGDRIRDAVVPQWAQDLPGYVDKLQTELSSAPGSLADEIWQEAHDPEINPEILREATVRVSSELCDEEKLFLKARKIHTRKGLAQYLGVAESEIHPDDIPIIAMCGSGGGLRALVAGTASYLSAQEAGLFDCVTYTAGVSGSCWLQGLYYSTISGQRHDAMIEHLKHRLGVHIAFPPPLLKLLTSAPTNKFLLSGGFEKYRGVKDADFGIVDVYGLMLGARLLVPHGDLGVDATNLKISNQRRFTDGGRHPLPIYTAVRHEIPIEEVIDEASGNKAPKDVIAKAKKEAWFQWFEITPYEFWCEELSAGIPTWALGREFRAGHNIWRENGLCLPELRLPLLMGIFGSAFCATLSHYYKEVRPLMLGLTGFGDVDGMINQRDDDLVKVHPIDPAQVPNFALGMRGQLPEGCPESVHTSPNFQLMDAGMSNNLPIYPLLRPHRNVDIIIAFDASADVRTDNWLRVVDDYAMQRGVTGWPLKSGWPDQQNVSDEQLKSTQSDTAVGTDASPPTAATGTTTTNTNTSTHDTSDLSYCTIWAGKTTPTSQTSIATTSTTDLRPHATRITTPTPLTDPATGIAVIYFPLLPNPAVPSINPQTSDFMSTWNFVYTPEQVDGVVELARRNFEEGKEATRMCVRAVWERKRGERWRREEEGRGGEWVLG